VAKKNEDVNEKVVSSLKREIEDLKKQLKSSKENSASIPTAEMSEDDRAKMKEMEQKLAEYEQMLRQQTGAGHHMHTPSNTDQILAAMDAVKDKNKALIKSITILKEKKEALKLKFTSEKNQYANITDTLKKEMSAYKEAYSQDEASGGNGESPMLDKMVESIEKLKVELTNSRKSLNEVKNALTEVGNKLVESESELEVGI
jgi:hypothetical protein